MKNLNFKVTRLISNLYDKEKKKLFLVINLAWIIGRVSLISTFLYHLTVNLDKADKIAIICDYI